MWILMTLLVFGSKDWEKVAESKLDFSSNSQEVEMLEQEVTVNQIRLRLVSGMISGDWVVVNTPDGRFFNLEVNSPLRQGQLSPILSLPEPTQVSSLVFFYKPMNRRAMNMPTKIEVFATRE
ncbi:MAG: hypothetical protein H6510_02285 [Acidobacteria bacterium]|nr:hypothetical protein [Acidobacteriota bacterium]MCB9396622.1 hypothetical protein [Acidobacteriota bacterium]